MNPSTRIVLRAATRADLLTVMTWVPNAAACRRWAGPRVGFPLVAGRLARDIGWRAGNAFCLCANDRPVAFAQLLATRPRVRHMTRVIVSPQDRGAGYGRALCRRLIDDANAAGVDRITLFVYRDNHAALRLYRSLGWRNCRLPLARRPLTGLCYMVRPPGTC